MDAQGSNWLTITLEGLVGRHSLDSLSKEGNHSTNHSTKVNHVQSTTWETSSYGDPDPRPYAKVIKPKGLKSHPRRRVETQMTQGSVKQNQYT